MKEILVHPRTFDHEGCWKLLDFMTPVPDLSSFGLQQEYPCQSLRRISLVGDIKDPFEVLLHLMTQLPRLQLIKVGSFLHSNLGDIERGHELNDVRFKSWLCLATLTHLDIAWMDYKDDEEMAWFVQKLQALERLTSLVLGMGPVRRAKSILSPGPIRVTKGFFYFPSVTRVTIDINYYGSWLDTPLITYEEAAFVVRSAPLLRSLTFHRQVEMGCSGRLEAAYPQLVVVAEMMFRILK